VRVLPVRGFRSELFADPDLIGGAVLGVGEQDVPERGEAFQIGIAALGDQRCDSFGAPAGDPQPDRGTVIVDVERELVEPEVLDQSFGNFCEPLEAVGELGRRRHR
jgi:hypothetical protein